MQKLVGKSPTTLLLVDALAFGIAEKAVQFLFLEESRWPSLNYVDTIQYEIEKGPVRQHDETPKRPRASLCWSPEDSFVLLCGFPPTQWGCRDCRRRSLGHCSLGTTVGTTIPSEQRLRCWQSWRVSALFEASDLIRMFLLDQYCCCGNMIVVVDEIPNFLCKICVANSVEVV